MRARPRGTRLLPMAAVTAPADTTPTSEGGATADVGFRYGAVLALALTVAVFLIAAPAGDWSRALGLLLEFTALLVVVITSSERERVRERRALALGAAAL